MSEVQQSLLPVAQAQAGSDDYYTPKWVFDQMGITFDIDVCAPPGGVEWVPAAAYYSVEDDGLAQQWKGRVWMNPPYSKPAPWVQRFIAHRNGICLVPCSNGRWFHELWERADGLCLPAPNALKFVGGGIPIRTMLAAFGEECTTAIGRFGSLR